MHATEFKLFIVNFSIDYVMCVFTVNSWQSNHYNLRIIITKNCFSKTVTDKFYLHVFKM